MPQIRKLISPINILGKGPFQLDVLMVIHPQLDSLLWSHSVQYITQATTPKYFQGINKNKSPKAA